MTRAFAAALFLALAACALPAPIAHAAETESFTVGLKAKGLAMTANVMVNGEVDGTFIIDTGASFTALSEKFARRLGLPGLKHAPAFPLSTASGVAWVKLVLIESVDAGGAEVSRLEGVVSSSLPEGIDGLLGRNFLDEFVYKLDSRGKTLTLKSPKGEVETRGGKPERWWRLRFARYSDAIKRFRSYLKQNSEKLAANNRAPNKNRVFTRRDMEKAAAFYEKLYEDLSRRAREAGAPESWKEEGGG